MEVGERSDFSAAARTPSARNPRPSDSTQSTATSSLTLQESCPICLDSMKPGEGHALFTAECSHMFHFRCIALSVEHGNQVCPMCRSMWKVMPFGNSASDYFPERPTVNALDWPLDDHWMSLLHESAQYLLRF